MPARSEARQMLYFLVDLCKHFVLELPKQDQDIILEELNYVLGNQDNFVEFLRDIGVTVTAKGESDGE